MMKWTGSKTMNGRSTFAVSLARAAFATALLGASMVSPSYADQSITSIRVAPSAGNTRVVFDLSGPASYKLFTLDNPSRVVVDFTDTHSRARSVGIPSEAVVTNVRSAVQANNALRMVLDLKQPASAKGFVLPPDGQAGHRLVVDIAHPGAVVQKPAATGASATASIGAAHIYGGNPFVDGQPYAAANKTASVAVPVANRPALPPANTPTVASAPASDTDVAAIKALLEQSGGPFAKPAAPAAKPAAVPVAPAATKVPSVVVPGRASASVNTQPVNATPPPVVAVKPLQGGVVVTEKAAEKSPPVPVKTVAASKPAPAQPAPAKVLPQPVKSMALARPASLRDVIVAIDAGHGGQDPGAIGPSGMYEKHITLAIARVLQAELSKQEGVDAKLVRTGDYFIPLASRRDIARTKHKADLFVSIHADAALARKARGASVFTLSRTGATSSLAAMLADRENQSDLVGGALESKDKMVASVIADLALEGAMEHSMKVGSTVLRELGGTTPLHKRYIEKAGFAVLKSADFPSILVETGFISNPQEEANLRSQVHQQKLARAITRGVMAYFTGNPPPGTYLAWKRDKGSSTLAYAEPSDARSSDTQHKIARGETLEKIASRYQVGLSDLRRANALSQNDTIKAGQVLQIPDT